MAFNPEKCLKIHALDDNTYVGLPPSKVDGSSYYFSKTGNDDDWVADGLILDSGEFAYVKGTNYPSVGEGEGETSVFQMIAKRYTVSGSIMSLVDDGAGELEEITQDYGFCALFCGSYIPSIDSQILTAKKLSKGCYKRMFILCSLEHVYEFFLPAEELAAACYNSMFAECENLQGPIRIMGKELQPTCFYHMFYGCRKLNEVYVYFQEWLNEATSQWFNYTSDTGCFHCPKFLPKKLGIGNIPTNWEIKEYRVKGSVNAGFQIP